EPPTDGSPRRSVPARTPAETTLNAYSEASPHTGGVLMSESPAHPAAPSRAGSTALVVGALSLLCSLVPVVGDIVSVPLALVAIVCGVLVWVTTTRAVHRGCSPRCWARCSAASRC